MNYNIKILTLKTLSKSAADDILKFICYFSEKIRLNMKYQILFSQKISVSSAVAVIRA